MRLLKILIAPIFLINISLTAQENQKRPKLLIGIVVDQMRYDYLLRFQEHFKDRGFKRMTEEGMNFSNVYYSFKPTKTAPGHATIFTGTTPSIHGIVGNNWYSRIEKGSVYCVRRDDVAGVKSKYNPSRMKVNTLADEIKLSLGENSKSFGISLKDRGAILPAGHMANGAYWFNGAEGGFISSDYYQEKSPAWVNDFNAKDFYAEYLQEGWSLLKDKKAYSQLKDDRPFERPFMEDGKVVFPYKLKKYYEKEGDEILKTVPQGNQILADFAKTLILNEEMGKDEQLDFLSISFSATDYIGHQFGVQSREVMDTYLRLDQTLADFFLFLDQEMEGEYVVFLTADHGAAENRNSLKEKGIPSGYLNLKQIQKDLEGLLDSLYGHQKWISIISNMNVYFNYDLSSYLAEKGTEWVEVEKIVYDFLLKQPGVYGVYHPDFGNTDDFLNGNTARGFNNEESGDMVIIEKANWNTYPSTGSGHASPYSYDTHVPLLIYGKGIEAFSIDEHFSVTDIIPSFASQLGISQTDGVRPFKMIPFIR